MTLKAARALARTTRDQMFWEAALFTSRNFLPFLPNTSKPLTHGPEAQKYNFKANWICLSAFRWEVTNPKLVS